MGIHLKDIASDLDITPKTLGLFITGEVRSELMTRRISDYTGLPWKLFKDLSPDRVVAALFNGYLEKHHSWLKHIKNPDFDYENACRECA